MWAAFANEMEKISLSRELLLRALDKAQRRASAAKSWGSKGRSMPRRLRRAPEQVKKFLKAQEARKPEFDRTRFRLNEPAYEGWGG